MGVDDTMTAGRRARFRQRQLLRGGGL